MTAEDVAQLAVEGRTIRLIATAQVADDGALEAAVVPTAVPASSPFGRCDGVLNRVEIDALPVAGSPSRGRAPVGRRRRLAVLGDLRAVARGVGSTWAGLAPATGRSTLPLRPVAGEGVAAPSGACYPVGD